MPPHPFTRLGKLCLALPNAHEVVACGEPTFRVWGVLAELLRDSYRLVAPKRLLSRLDA